jgi:hypothetical protein
MPDEHTPTLQDIAAEWDWWLHDAGTHYRNLAVGLRETAGKCRLPRPQKELLNLPGDMSLEPITWNGKPGDDARRPYRRRNACALNSADLVPHRNLIHQPCVTTRQKSATRSLARWMPAFLSPARVAATFEGGAIVTTYRVTLRDRETQTIVGYYNGTWTTDGRRALTLRERKAAETPRRPHARSLSAQCRRHQG